MDEPNPPMNRLAAGARGLLQEALKTSWTLFRIMVPVLILVRLLQQAGAVEWLGDLLGPAMRLVGLPGSMGLVWATAMLVNLYAAIVVFASLAPEAPLTVAQVTVLASMMMVAHGLLVELRIAQKAGPRLRVMAVLRLAGAFALGWSLNQIYTRGGFLQATNTPIFPAMPRDLSWPAWVLGQATNLCLIFLIILSLLFLMKVLKRVGITALLTRLLGPVLRMLGMSKDAAPITIGGMTLGLTFGGGLIIREAQSGRLSRRDVFFSLALMSLCHSLIEDTILMTALGAHPSGILLGRITFSLVVVFLLVKLLGAVSEDLFDRFFVRAAGRKVSKG